MGRPGIVHCFKIFAPVRLIVDFIKKHVPRAPLEQRFYRIVYRYIGKCGMIHTEVWGFGSLCCPQEKTCLADPSRAIQKQ